MVVVPVWRLKEHNTPSGRDGSFSMYDLCSLK